MIDPESTKRYLSDLITSISKFMPVSSQTLHALLRLQALIYTPPKSVSDRATAIQSLALAYKGAEHLYPQGHPIRAIILAEWGKLLAMEVEGDQTKQEVLRSLVEAVTVLRKAFTACEEGFGPGGGLVGREVEGLIRGCEGEIGLIRGYSSR